MVKKDGSMVEMEIVCLDPGTAESPFPVDTVPENLVRWRVSLVRKNDGGMHTSCGRRVDECYVNGRTCGDVGRGFRKLGKETIGRGDCKVKPRSGLALPRVMQCLQRASRVGSG